MKKFIYLFLTILMSIFMISCSGLFEQEKGSIVVKMPGSAARAAAPGVVSYYNIFLQTESAEEDGSIEEPLQIEKRALPGQTVVFSDLEEGNYYVSAEAYNSSEDFICGGEPEDVVTVKKGKTTVAAITFYYSADISDNTGTVLFNSNSIWGLYSDDDLASASARATGLTDFSDFTFDAYGNLYVYYYLPNDSESRFIERFDKNSDGNYSSEAITLMGIDEYKAQLSYIERIAFDSENNALYICSNDGESSNKLYKINDASSNPTVMSTTNSYGLGWNEYALAVFGGYAYFAVHQDNDNNYYIERANLSDNDGFDVSSIKNVNLSSLYSKAFPDYYEGMEEDVTVTDIAANIEGVYLLVRQVSGSFDKNHSCDYSRGAVIRLDSNLNYKSTTGWSSNKATYKIGTDKNTASMILNLYTPTNPSKQFYGPVKFVAVKPKKLVIADDGAGIDFVSGNLSSNCFSQKNRIIEYDLESQSITKVTPVNAEFSSTISTGCGFENNDYIFED